MINAMKYERRRQVLGKRYHRTLFVIPSGSDILRSHSSHYRFKAKADFLYLLGMQLKDATLLVIGKKTYLLKEKETEKEILWGDREHLSLEQQYLLRTLCLGESSQLKEIILSHIKDFDRIAYPVGQSLCIDQDLLSIIAYSRSLNHRYTGIPMSICDSRLLIGTLRLIKEKEEVDCIQEAALRSSYVHAQLMGQNFIGKTELEISHWIESNFLSKNMQWTAYETIVGSGKRSTLLHARASEKKIFEGEIIIVDAAGEWDGYCADITRTIPSGKKFTIEQKEIYKIVLSTQKRVIQSTRSGTTLSKLHELAMQSLIDGLCSIGIKADQELVKNLMPHNTSHWLGMDVHDPCPHYDDSGKEIHLIEGMVFTIEPGLYFRQKTLNMEKYFGIGVRIEDDVVVTGNGCKVLSAVPKEVEEIEKLRADIE